MSVDKVRASREGHEFHEAWAARRCLELLLPRDGLCAVAIEGLSTREPTAVLDATDEIADLTLYFGAAPRFKDCDRLEILQCKYSVASADDDFVASDAKETLAKFAASDRDFVAKHGRDAVERKVTYAFVVNRPIGGAFFKAIEHAANATVPAAESRETAQLTQIKATTGLDGAELQSFCARLGFRSASETPEGIRRGASRTVADWSGGNGGRAALRMHELSRLVRSKAGMAGTSNNVVRVVDVLDVLGVEHEKDLLPTEASFTDIGSLVPRAQEAAALDLIAQAALPILIRAPGGVGKTVFLQSLAEALPGDGVVLFDCFAGSAYRSPDDERHLPQRGLMHVVNVLATRGLCDPLLPGAEGDGDLLRTAQRRFQQAVATLRRNESGAKVVILMDAADNAAQQAQDRSETSFPSLLLSAYASKPEDGVVIVASCRPEREILTRGRATVSPFDLEPFNLEEAKDFLGARVSNITEAEFATAMSRSQRNPRVLQHLATDWDGLVRAPISNNVVTVEELIAGRVDRALAEAGFKGAGDDAVEAFMAGLTLLPTPIPTQEYAVALDVTRDEIESFCADLAPLLDRSSVGITFRDEPTEFYVRTRFGSSQRAIGAIAARLISAQRTSLYAAKSLPRLYQLQKNKAAAVALALSDDMPSAIVGDLGKRSLKAARINAAIALCADGQSHDELVSLLVEMGTLASVNSRGDAYLSAHPEFIYLSDDQEGLRRLMAGKSAWHGHRHARVAIIQCLHGEREDALREVRRLEHWNAWFFGLDQKEHYRQTGPSADDFAAIALVGLVESTPKDFVRYLNGWKSRKYAFRVARRAVQLLAVHPDGRALITEVILSRQKSVAFHAAVLAAGPLLAPDEISVSLEMLAASVVPIADRGVSPDTDDSGLSDALVMAAALAVMGGRKDYARDIMAAVSTERMSDYDMEHERLAAGAATTVLRSMVRAMSEDRKVALVDCLPWAIVRLLGDANPSDLTALEAAIDKKLEEASKKTKPSERLEYGTQDGDRYKRIVRQRVEPMVSLANELLAIFGDESLTGDAIASGIVGVWRAKRPNQETYRDSPRLNYMADGLCRATLFFALAVRRDVTDPVALDAVAVDEHDEWAFASARADYVWHLARNPLTASAAGRLASRTAAAIEAENFVERRGEMFAELAEAMLPASVPDAVAYFQRGLKELDTIGAGDFELMQEILLLASKMKGDYLPDVQAQRLMNLCAINFGDEPSKFFWWTFADAAARAIGPNALGQLSRWDQRGEATFEYTLATAISSFANAGHLSISQALALLILDEPSESWAWRSAYLLETLLTKATPGQHPNVFVEFMRQLGLAEPSGVSPLTLDAVAKVVPKFSALEPFGEALVRAHKISATRNDERNARANQREDERNGGDRAAREAEEAEQQRTLAVLVAAADPSDAASVEQLLATASEFRTAFAVEKTVLDGLRAKTLFGRRLAHIDVLISVAGIHLWNRLEAIAACIALWASDTPSIRDARSGLALRLVARCGSEIVEEDHGLASRIRDLSKLSEVSTASVATALIDHAATHGVSMKAAHWLYLAGAISEHASSTPLRDALIRLLDSPSAKLADDRYDGRFTQELRVPADVASQVAGLIWQRLADPDAAMRWRAAHAVRLLARQGLTDELADLAVRYHACDLGAFGDKWIKLHAQNARLWLLMALARAGAESPNAIVGLESFLTALCFAEPVQHVICRAFAADALGHILDATGRTHERDRLASVTATSIPKTPRPKGFHPGVGSGRRLGNGTESFIFDYEFDKYDVDNVADLFGTTHATVAEDVAAVVRSWDPAVQSMYDGGGRRSRHDSSYGRGVGRVATYGEQLAWHALVDVASRYAQTKPVVEDDWDADPWATWIAEKRVTCRDGRWLADGTETFPEIAQRTAFIRVDGKLQLPKSVEALAALADFHPCLLPEWLPTEGAWQSADGVSIRLHSALISRFGAYKQVGRLAHGPRQDVWLPTLQVHDDGEGRHRYQTKAQPIPLEPWIIETECTVRMDEYDIFGVKAAAEHPVLARHVRDALGLATQDPFGRVWTDRDGTEQILNAAWGFRRGLGRYENSESSSMMRCRSTTLLQYLRAHDKCLVLHIRFDHYPPSDAYGSERVEHHAECVAVMSGTGNVKFFGLRRQRSNRPKGRRKT